MNKRQRTANLIEELGKMYDTGVIGVGSDNAEAGICVIKGQHTNVMEMMVNILLALETQYQIPAEYMLWQLQTGVMYLKQRKAMNGKVSVKSFAQGENESLDDVFRRADKSEN